MRTTIVEIQKFSRKLFLLAHRVDLICLAAMMWDRH